MRDLCYGYAASTNNIRVIKRPDTINAGNYNIRFSNIFTIAVLKKNLEIMK